MTGCTLVSTQPSKEGERNFMAMHRRKFVLLETVFDLVERYERMRSFARDVTAEEWWSAWYYEKDLFEELLSVSKEVAQISLEADLSAKQVKNLLEMAYTK